MITLPRARWIVAGSLVALGCDRATNEPRPPVGAVSPSSVATAPATAAGSADPLESMFTRPLGGGFVLFDDGHARDSQAPIVALIVPASAGPRFYRGHGKTAMGYWTPTARDVWKMDAHRNTILAKVPAIARHANDYRYQLVGIVEGERRLVFVNAFCHPPASWQREPVSVDDGGACYFTFKYDPASGERMDLQVNGEG